MKCTIAEISWHNREPVLSVDFQSQTEGKRRLATAGFDAHVLIWYVEINDDGHVKVEFASDLTRHNKAVNVVRFSPDGRTLASGDDEAAIWLWKLSEKETLDFFAEESEKENKEHWIPLRSLRCHVEDVCDLSWSPDGCFLVSGSVDNTAIVWDVQKGRNVVILSDHKGFVQGVSWDPLNKFVATLSSDRACRIYSVSTKKVLHKVHRMNLSSSNEQSTNKQVRMYHDDTLKSFSRRLAFTPNGELLITPAGILELEDDKKMNTTYIFARNSFHKPALYLPSGDKSTVAVRCCPVLFQLRDFKNKKGKNENSENYTMFDLPYRIVFAVATHNSVLLYDTQQPLPFGYASNLHYTRLSDLAWSHDGSILIVSSTDGYCSFLTFKSGELGVPHILEKSGNISIIEDKLNRSLEEQNLLDSSPDHDKNSVNNSKLMEDDDLKLVLELTNEPTNLDLDEKPVEMKIECDSSKGRKQSVEEENNVKLAVTKDIQDAPFKDVLSSSTVQMSTSGKPPRRVQLITLSSPKQTKKTK